MSVILIVSVEENSMVLLSVPFLSDIFVCYCSTLRQHASSVLLLMRTRRLLLLLFVYDPKKHVHTHTHTHTHTPHHTRLFGIHQQNDMKSLTVKSGLITSQNKGHDPSRSRPKAMWTNQTRRRVKFIFRVLILQFRVLLLLVFHRKVLVVQQTFQFLVTCMTGANLSY